MKTLHDALLICGTQQNLADICGVSQSLISQWISGKKSPSPASVVSILRETGIDLRHLHPDVFILAAPPPEEREKEPRPLAPRPPAKRRVNVDLDGRRAGDRRLSGLTLFPEGSKDAKDKRKVDLMVRKT